MARKVALATILVVTLVALVWFFADAPPTHRYLYSEAELRGKNLGELLNIREELMDEQGRAEASIQLPTLPSLVADSDIIVEGTVQAIDVDMDFLIECIATGKVRALYGDITLQILDSEPNVDVGAITIPAAFSRDSFSVGDHIFVPLIRIRDAYRPQGGLDYCAKVIEVDGKTIVSGFASMPNYLGVEETWDRIRDTFEDLDGRSSDADVRNWLDTLRNGTPVEAFTALERLESKPGTLNAGLLLAALEDQHRKLIDQVPAQNRVDGPALDHINQQVNEFTPFAQKTMDLLLPLADASTAERVLNLYLHDMTTNYVQVFDNSDLSRAVFGILIRPEDPNRVARAKRVLGQWVEYYDDQGGQIGSSLLIEAGYYSLCAIATTPGEDMDRLLEEILENPETYVLSGQPPFTDELKRELANMRRAALAQTQTLSNAAVLSEYLRRYRAGNTGLGLSIWFRADGPTQELIDFLLADERLENWTPLIAAKAGSPQLASKLSESIRQNGPYRMALEALDACGTPDQALLFASQALEGPIANDDLDAFELSLQHRIAALRYLGGSGHLAASELIRTQLAPSLGDKVAAAQRRAYERTFARTSEDRKQFLGYRSPLQNPSQNFLRDAALLALTKLRDATVTKHWKDVLESGRQPEKAIAAVALFYLGDAAGTSFMEAFASHEERIDRDYDRRLMTEGATGEVLKTLLYLRSTQTDEFLLRRLDTETGWADHDVFYDLAFVSDYRDRVLALLLDHLESDSSMTRRDANQTLDQFLRVDVGWDDQAGPRTQPEKVLEWRNHVEDFLDG